MTDLRDLLEALRRGACPSLSVDDVELLLGWLTGSATRDDRNDGDGADLPRPGHDPVLLHMVFYRLDSELFAGEELQLAAAGLDGSEPATRRRIRYRRLASAFHPDRFPELADWLTERSQAVHRAYARFKQNPDAPAAGRQQPPLHARAYGFQAQRQDMRHAPPRARRHRIRAFADLLRARFGNDRYLAYKLVGGLAILALLPVLNMVLVPAPEDKGTVSGFRFPLSGEKEEDTVSGFRFPVSAGEAVDAEGKEDESGDFGVLQNGKASLSEQAPTPLENTGEESVGAVSGRDRAGAEAETADLNAPARKPQTGNPKPSSAALDPEISPLLAAARRAMNPYGDVAPVGTLPTVDEQLAAIGLPTDTERLYRRMGDEEETVSGFRFPLSAGEAVEAEGQEDGSEDSGMSQDGKASLAEQAPTPLENTGRDQAADVETTDLNAPARKPETVGSNQPTSQPITLPPGDLVLGPFARHPAGEVLAGLHGALQRGNIPGVAAVFAEDARLDSLSGRGAIAGHFRAMLARTDSRQVHLKVIRLARDGERWRVEAEVAVRIRRDGIEQQVMRGRSNLWLAAPDDQLMITRMQRE